MITFFNRKELCLTMSMRAQSELRAILQQNQIEYKLKLVDESVNRMAGVQNAMPRGKSTTLYTFYVLKKDYEKAKACIQGIRLQD